MPAFGRVVVPAGLQVALSVPRAEKLSLTPLDELAPDALDGLDLGWTRTYDRDIRHIARLTGLIELDLGMTRITTDGVTAVAGLSNLRVLKLGHTKVDDGAAATIARFSRLERLKIRATRMTDAGLDELDPLRALRRLDVRGTAMTSDAIRRFAEAPGREALTVESDFDVGPRHE